MKKSILLCCSLILLVIAFWLGEAGHGPFQIHPYIIGIAGLGVISSLASKNLGYRTATGLIFIVLYLAAFYTGSLSFDHAFDICIDDAEEIREDLVRYKARNGNFPESLEELNIELPCSRIWRGSILQYTRTETGYQI